MSSELNGKVALVTGASRGLGEGAARALAAAGAAVMLVARDGALAGNVARDIATKGGRAEALSCDVSDYAAVEKIVAETKARLGGIDILINNAGVIDPIAEVATSDPAAWAQNISINLIGAHPCRARCCPTCWPKAAGRSSTSRRARLPPARGMERLLCRQAGLAMLAAAVDRARDRRQGIRIFGFSPGTIDTDMQVKIRASGMNMISRIPRGDLSPVEHAVRGLLHLCSPATDDLMGQDASMRDEAFRRRIGLG